MSAMSGHACTPITLKVTDRHSEYKMIEINHLKLALLAGMEIQSQPFVDYESGCLFRFDPT